MADKAEMLLSTPLGSLLLAADALGLTGVRLVTSPSAARETRSDNPLLREAAGQIAAYFAGRLRRFDLPLHPAGTPFQQRVWAALREIPYGETRSYKDIAQAVGSPRAFRAVGMANHKNPLLLVTPCHRVIAADGALRGFACGLECKSFLLRFERENILKK
ncbi:methylated-DNA--[protein]-cysteine S-methyltransferase [uncultured Desulfovibrio sp.]|uniref:methylated-DNA--[protein]-cysteine S-methyltransferase n=1 Tax=uncultured Desulfovibrio sp. TaxID=167968 RepID=UPI001C398A98|nr:methylated-DNA--[protein]-cysteine S-methyltransferase [uncultured Desulfovibrio sp.]HIX39461.1 methylated-DNA--[protein]-cysteine S-methyltransferase [Candidatus Desulfovibrio intestinigallinarum]